LFSAFNDIWHFSADFHKSPQHQTARDEAAALIHAGGREGMTGQEMILRDYAKAPRNWQKKM